MITIGMSLGGDDNARSLAVAIRNNEGQHFNSSNLFQTPVKLWEMQTLLLREVFDKMLCGRREHETAQSVPSSYRIG